MKSSFLCNNLIIFLTASLIKAQLGDFLNFSLQRERIKCIGVRCPSERPKCIVESRVAKCVAEAAAPNKNRLSRPAPGLLLSRPSRGGGNPFLQTSIFQKRPVSSNSQLPNLCLEPPKTGLCRAYFQSFYFNPRSGQCEMFIYGGCGGNNNRFRYERDCKVTCADPFSQLNGKDSTQSAVSTTGPPLQSTETSKIPVCQLRPDPGPCFAYFTRFYFNLETKRCERFTYGGCQGNENNFQSFATCQQACGNPQQSTQQSNNQATVFPSQMPEFELLISASTNGDSFPSSSVLGNTDTVQSLPGKGFSTGSAFQTSTSASLPICSLPKKVGPCRARIPRYYFNNDTQTCEQFIYGGCHANKNNFQSEQNCLQACSNTNIIRNRPFPMTQMHPFPFWSDPTKDAAFREFLIRRQMKASGNLMGAATTNYFVCTQPVNQGSCFEKIQSFFFNSQTGSCEPFVFRGCGGNRNRFKTREACEQFCLNNQLANTQQGSFV